MGSGKTTIGSIVAGRLGRQLIDSDAQIEGKYGLTGRELVDRHGVSWLHQAEAEELRQAVAASDPSVIAAAASTADIEEVAAMLGGEDIVIVLLIGDAEVLALRGKSGEHRRPIDVERSQALAEHRNRRILPVADGVIDVTTSKPEEVATMVMSVVRRTGMTSRRIPIACNLERAEFGERMKEWRALIASALIEKRETEVGIRLIFGAEAEVELERLAAAERECCEFATWTVTRHQENEVALDVRAEGSGVEALHLMFE
jgi:shikimate kinase